MPNNQQVTLVIDDVIDRKAQKLEQLKAVLNDPLFLADIKEVQNDFDPIVQETQWQVNRLNIYRANPCPVVGSEQGKSRPVSYKWRWN